MAKAFDWRSDPIVQIEQEIGQVVSLCAMWLTDTSLAPQADLSAQRAELADAIDRAEACFQTAGKPLFATMDIETPQNVNDLCQSAAGTVRKLGDKIDAIDDQATSADLARLANFLRQSVSPLVQDALDGLRGTFITEIVQRQNEQKLHASLAIRQVREISKKIFFISINASVEAARVGDAGRGFSMISQEIRTLSQTAKAAVDDLSSATN